MLQLHRCAGRDQWDSLAAQVCADAGSLLELLDALEGIPLRDARGGQPTQRTQQLAGYVLLHVHRKCPEVLTPHLDRLHNLLLNTDQRPQHASIPRQLYSVFQDRAVPERLAGTLYARALDDFLARGQAVGIRARALQTCANIAAQYDGLWTELAAVAAEVSSLEPPGILSISRRVAKQAKANG